MKQKTAVVVFIIAVAALGTTIYFETKTTPPPTILKSLAPFGVKYDRSVSIPVGGSAKALYSVKGADLKVESPTFKLIFLRKPPPYYLYIPNPYSLPEGINAVIEPEQLTIRPWDKEWQTATITIHVDPSVKPGNYTAAIQAVSTQGGSISALLNIEVIDTGSYLPPAVY